jgi:hypothetical protein
MSRTIWKFTLDPMGSIGSIVGVSMPTGAEVISAGVQWDKINVWAIVDPDAPISTRFFFVIGTGHEFPEGDGVKFINTVQLIGGSLVMHIFERIA